MTAASTTLGDLHHATPWLWLHCEACRHYSPLACAIPVIRWGASASSDVLRLRARCTACGHKGATLQLPSWVGADVGMMPFPVRRRQSTVQSGEVMPTASLPPLPALPLARPDS